MPPRTHLRPAITWLVLGIFFLLVSVIPAAAQGNVHVVQPGETLFRIALRYGVTVDSLVAANNIANPSQIYAGQAIMIATGGAEPPPVAIPVLDPAPVVSAPVYHVVQRGETLGTIARRYGVTWQELAAANNIPNPNRILAGQQLVIMQAASPVNTAAIPPAAEPAAPPPAADPVITTAPVAAQTQTHIVQRGEHLAAIARRYGISWTAIARANNIVDPNRIYAGQALAIPAAGDIAADPTYFTPTVGQPSGPTPTITNGRQIIVDLSEQRVYAYQDGQLVFNSIASTGLPATPTVTGDFNIYWKLTDQTMSGPGYYLPGVPWVMYFYAGYALHGTYWHNNFGHPMSHGCVNLPTENAAWLFNFADVGTPVRVIY